MRKSREEKRKLLLEILSQEAAKRKEKREKEAKNAAALLSWAKKRREFKQACSKGYSPSDGELVNMIDELTPDGYDKQGRKVSFVEDGRQFFFSKRPYLLSERRDR